MPKDEAIHTRKRTCKSEIIARVTIFPTRMIVFLFGSFFGKDSIGLHLKAVWHVQQSMNRFQQG